MALTLPADTDDVLSLAEYVEHMNHQVDFDDLDSILASAPQLRALANHRTFLCQEITAQLRDWRRFQLGNSYTAPSLLFAPQKRFMMRINAWNPPAGGPGALRDELFSYKLLHDHNFSFMTVGYFGSGYETILYDYDHGALDGRVGEDAQLRYLGREALTPGKVMFYRASKDVHQQEHPAEFSLSLNLILIRPSESLLDQYIFDHDGRISEVPGGANTSRMGLCELAQHVGDAATAAALDEVAARHPNHRVRNSAYQALLKLDPAARPAALARALQDAHPLVRQAARVTLEGSTS